MWLFALELLFSAVIGPSLQQSCTGTCGQRLDGIINVTAPNSVIIPCGDLLSSPTSRVDYCNATNNNFNQPLETGVTTEYNLTLTEPGHHNNAIYCTDNHSISCYRLNVFFASFVPSDFQPVGVSREFAETAVPLFCPFENVGNPRPNCTWSRIDNNNITHQLLLTKPEITKADSDDDSFCSILLFFTENDNGLYQCTGHNGIGNTTYTFPERFVVENCSVFATVPPTITLISQPSVNINVGDNVTLQCTASPITKNASLHWVVDGDEHNTTGIFSSSRGQLMVEEPVLDAVSCIISSSLTITDVQLNSQGAYICSLQDNNYTLTKNTSLTLNIESSTEESSAAAVLGGAVTGIVIFLLILIVPLVIAVLFYRHHRNIIYCRNQLHEPDFNYEYDVFLSFAERDLENVEKIYKALENDYNYRVVWHHRDFTVGVPSEQNMEEFIQKSRKVVIVLTQAFLESDHCKNEYAIAYSRLADNKENCMIMVLFASCSTPREVKFLKQLHFRHSHFMENLIDSLGKPICEATSSL